VTSVIEVRSASARLFAGTWHPWLVLLQHRITLRLFFIIECGIARSLCAMRVFDLWVSSSSPGLPSAKFSLVSAATSTAELTYGENHALNHTLAQSLT